MVGHRTKGPSGRSFFGRSSFVTRKKDANKIETPNFLLISISRSNFILKGNKLLLDVKVGQDEEKAHKISISVMKSGFQIKCACLEAWDK